MAYACKELAYFYKPTSKFKNIDLKQLFNSTECVVFSKAIMSI